MQIMWYQIIKEIFDQRKKCELGKDKKWKLIKKLIKKRKLIKK